MRDRQRGGAVVLVPVSCRLSPTGVRFLSILFPPEDSAVLTIGLPRRRGGRTLSGFPCSARNEIRPGWVPSLLRGGGVVPVTATWVTGACRFTAASPVPPLEHPIGGGWDYEAYEDSLAFTRPAFPLPAVPGWNGNGFGFSPGLRTPQSPVTHAKAGTVLVDTGPGHTSRISTSKRYDHSSRATFTSHGRPPSGRGRHGRRPRRGGRRCRRGP